MATSTFGRGRPDRSAGPVLPLLVIMVMLGSCAAPAPHPARGWSAVPAIHSRLAVSVPLGGEVDGLAAGGGYLWAYVRDTGVLVRVDQRTGQARRFVLGAWRGMPVVLAAGPHGLWLANQHSTRPGLASIDPRAPSGSLPGRAYPATKPGRSPASQPPTGHYQVLVPTAPSPPDGGCCA